jgi:hypothetical protein
MLSCLATLRRRPPEAKSDHCGICRSFRNDAAYLEAAIPGLSSFSSGFSSVRADDGLCLRHGRYLGAGGCCPQFAPLPESI